MPLIDITNPAVIKFLVESYDKTTRLRIKWNNRHAAKLKTASTLNREERGHFETDVFKKSMIAGMVATTRDHVAAHRNRRHKPIRDGIHVNTIEDLRKGHSIIEVGLSGPKDDPKLNRPDTDLSFDPTMRPMDPEQRRILTKDLPFYGREVYLKSRNKISPEKKYYFAETSGWEYGWRLKDSYFSGHSPSYGRVWRLTRGIKNRSGPQPDPPHYKDSNEQGPQKCFI